ncbi:NAD(P)/FAD-dependent oxidoreductase [Zhouia sp. PK063]|uniref:NAD(P)/FAD-dependent oxidoreductase n=1 Tax=Zhouia sp. PK063 TaxID=3373602 RepID=UPI0037A3D230
MKKIVVIGGGISGLCSAYYLVKEGYRVTVIDQHNITEGASFINAGYITPSHFLALAAPGVINQGIKWMFNSSSPFYIKPRVDIDFFKWTLNFKKSATAQKVKNSIPVLKELNLKSRDLFDEMKNAMDFSFHYERKGVLMAYTTPKMEEEELHMASIAKQEGLEVKIYSKADLKAIQPSFSDNVIGAVHYECDGHVTPNEFMKNLKLWLETAGVSFQLDQKVTAFKQTNNKIEAVLTNNNEVFGDEFVLAAGSWSFSLSKQLGLYIPIQGGKGYSMNVNRETRITLPAILAEAKVAVTPMEGFTRFAGTMEFSGNNNYIRKERVEAIANAVKKYYNNTELSSEEKNTAVSGLRPVSPDGVPFIGKTSKFTNLTVATGHAMMGFSLGPITGKLVEEIISNKKSTVNLSPLKVERF